MLWNWRSCAENPFLGVPDRSPRQTELFPLFFHPRRHRSREVELLLFTRIDLCKRMGGRSFRVLPLPSDTLRLPLSPRGGSFLGFTGSRLTPAEFGTFPLAIALRDVASSRVDAGTTSRWQNSKQWGVTDQRKHRTTIGGGWQPIDDCEMIVTHGFLLEARQTKQVL